MIFRGMIFQYNSEQGTGLIMLSDGEKKEFSTNDWADNSNSPKIGLEILYDTSAGPVKIKALSAQEKSRFLEDEKKEKEKPDDKSLSNEEPEVAQKTEEVNDETLAFTDFDEHVQYYVDHGFKLARDAENNGTRTASFRNYVMGDFQEITLKETDSKITVIKMLNGKQVD